MKFKLITGDNVEVLKKAPADVVDLTVTSPPYDDLRSYNGYTFDMDGFAPELFRVTKPGGIVVWVVNDATVNGDETGTSFRQALRFKQEGFNLHDTMIWRKTNPMPSDGRIKRYRQAFEYMFVFSKGRIKTCNHLMEPTKNAGKNAAACNNYPARRENGAKSSERIVSLTKSAKNERVKDNVWEMPVHGATDKISRNHPAAFPEVLAMNHILSWSNPGDLVLDPFVGSGTVGKAAIMQGRRFVGIDVSEEYIENIARPRIEGVVQALG